MLYPPCLLTLKNSDEEKGIMVSFWFLINSNEEKGIMVDFWFLINSNEDVCKLSKCSKCSKFAKFAKFLGIELLENFDMQISKFAPIYNLPPFGGEDKSGRLLIKEWKVYISRIFCYEEDIHRKMNRMMMHIYTRVMNKYVFLFFQ